MDGGNGDDEECQGVEDPRDGEDVDRRLHAEQRVPDDRRDEEDGGEDVELKVAWRT